MTIYEVKFNTLAILKDGDIGNVSQGISKCIFEGNLKDVEQSINSTLLADKKVCIVLKIDKLDVKFICAGEKK